MMKSVRGFSMIEILIVLMVLGILAAIAISLWPSSRIAANEGSAIVSLRSISTAQYLFWTAEGVDTFAADLGVLGDEGLIDSVLASGEKSGYLFVVVGVGETFSARANPRSEAEGRRSFYVDQSAVIRYSLDGEAGPGSSPIPSSIN